MATADGGSMLAVMGRNFDEIMEAIKAVASDEIDIANYNSPFQIVISGPEAAVDEVGRRLEGKEGVKFRKLRVSAAFHSPQMAEAAEEMKALIGRTTFREPKCWVIPNVTGKPTRDAAEIKANLIRQITGQVRWCDTILAMKEAGVTTLYETGYGDVLKKMNKTITFRPKCIGVEAG